MLKITVWCLLSLFLLQIYAIILTRHFIKVSVHRVLRRKPQVSCKNESVIICAIRCTRILPCKVFNVGSSKTFFSGQHDEMENSIFNKNNKEKENVGFRRKHDPVKNADAKGRQERVKKTVSGKHDSFKKNARRQRRKRKKNICHSLPSLKYARWQFPDKGKDSRRFVNVICDRKRKPFFVKKREVKCDAARKSWMTLDYDCLMSRITYADLSRMKHGIDLPCQLQYTSLLVSAVINPKFIFYLRNSKIPLYRVKVTLTRYTAVLEMCRDGRPKPIRTRIKQHTNVIFIQQSKHNDLEILFLGKEFYCTCGVPGFLDGVDQMSVHRDAVVKNIYVQRRRKSKRKT